MRTEKEQKKFQKALAAAREVFNDIDLDSITLPLESQSDLIREAASIVAYFDMRESFTEEICRGCGQVFAYSYYTTAVKHCSVPCLKRMIESMGLVWNPSKPYEERWGSRYVPAIVPATAYAIIKQQAPELETPEPTNAIGAADLMAKLNQLTGSTTTANP